MATLYLHIGTPKTGTSAIQFFCFANRRELARRGCGYPIFLYNDPHNGDFCWQAGLKEDGSFVGPEDERLWNARMDAISRCFQRCPSVLLSAERIWRAPCWGGLWKRLRQEAESRGFDLRVIVFLRRQDLFLNSWWAQMVKTGHFAASRLRWREMLEQVDDWVALDYYRHLEAISAEFGRDHVIARVYDRRRYADGNVLPDFLSVLGLSEDGRFVAVDAERNESVSGDALEIKRMLNQIDDLLPIARDRAQRAAIECTRESRARYTMFTPEELRTFLGKYEESNRLLARDYFGTDAPLFEEIGDPLPTWRPDDARMFASCMRFLELSLNYGATRSPIRRRLLRKLKAARDALRRKLWELSPNPLK